MRTKTIRWQPLRFFPALCMMAVIFLLSHQPGDTIHLPEIFNIDKLAHLAVYALLAGACLFALHPMRKSFPKEGIALGVVLFCLLYGISDEYHQSFIPNRYVSFWDVIADGTGAVLAVMFWLKKFF